MSWPEGCNESQGLPMAVRVRVLLVGVVVVFGSACHDLINEPGLPMPLEAPLLTLHPLRVDEVTAGPALEGAIAQFDSGEPILGGLVAIYQPGDTRTVLYSAMSGPAGRFRFSQIPPGHYILVARSIGHSTRRVGLTILPGWPRPPVVVGMDVSPFKPECELGIISVATRP